MPFGLKKWAGSYLVVKYTLSNGIKSTDYIAKYVFYDKDNAQTSFPVECGGEEVEEVIVIEEEVKEV